MKKLVTLAGILVLLVALAMLGASPAFADFGEQSDAPADHEADALTGFDVVDSDTDSADENTTVADVYPAGSENSVIVDEPVR